jgi:peptide/nickel transport system substrate-binding protein
VSTIVLLVSGLAWGLATALGASPSPAASGRVVLRLGWTTEPDNLNPFIGYANDTYEIWAIQYSYLFGCGDYNQPTLDLATEFPTEQNGGISPDGKVWTIHIRSGVKWQDGQPLTADDVAFTFNYIIKNDMTNLTNYTQGIKTVEVVDPTTVKIVCSAPKADLERATVPILPEHIWGKLSPQAAATTYVNKPPIIGSGPFQTVAFVKGSYVEMARNPYWYGKKPTIDQIYFEFYTNADTMVSDLKSGGIDGAWGVPEAEFKALGSVSGIKTVAYDYYDWDYVEFNCYDKPTSLGDPILRDWRFRNALNYAVDRQRLVQIAFSGLSAPATTIIPPHTFADPDYHWEPPADQLYTFDLAKAGQLLTAAGYPLKDGVRVDKQGDPITLRLMTATDYPEGQTESKLIVGWFQQLGLKLKLSVVDVGQFTSAIYNYAGGEWKPDFDLAVWSWGSYYDPGQTLACFTTKAIGSLNEPFWSDAEYDALNLRQSQTIDTQKRQALIWRMQQIMYEQTPWIVLTYPEELEAYDTSKWTGWTQMFGGTGPAWNCEGNYDSYLALQPAGTVASGSSHATTTVVVVVAAVVAVAVIVALVARSRRRGVRVEVD